MNGMQRKTIKQVLRLKTKAWLDSIEDEKLRIKCKRDAIVTGGAITSMLLGEEVNDFDIYFKTKETTNDVAEYYLEKFQERRRQYGRPELAMRVEEMNDIRGLPRIRIVVQSAGVESEEREDSYEYFEGRPDHEAGDYLGDVFEDPGEIQDLYDETQKKIRNETARENQKNKEDGKYRPVFLSTNAISLSGKIQLILRFYGEPEDIHENYDFIHCTNYYDVDSGQLYTNTEALEALMSKTLVYRGSRYPVASLFRIRKFIKRGWTINAGQIVKISLQISDLDLTDFKVLEDQLTGCDVAYFQEMLSNLEGERFDHAYLVEIIDKLFGD